MANDYFCCASNLKLRGHVIEEVRMRQEFTVWVLSLVGFLLVYSSEIIAELVSNTGPALFLRNDAGVPVVLFRIAILCMTASPIAYMTGYALIRLVPESSLRAIRGIASLYVLVIASLQLNVYEPSVLFSSILKVVSVVVPLAIVAFQKHPEAKSEIR